MPDLSLGRIFHPSDFSPARAIAFAHALKLALIARAERRIMHVAPETADVHWTDFPGVRATLARRGLLPESSPREAVAALGLGVQKILGSHTDPVDSIVHYLRRHPVDLVVLATHQYAGLARWVHQAVAAPMARRAATMTLFVPHGVEGFVSLADGAVMLRRILIPIDTVPRPDAAVAVAAGLAQMFGCEALSFTFVHVGTTDALPKVTTPQYLGWTCEWVVRQGTWLNNCLTLARAPPPTLSS
jgi:nucleotide-binding universal stress UspA family protein